VRALTVQFLVATFFLCAAAVVFANPFKSKIISGTDSVVVIEVPGDHFMKITNFTQSGGTDRAVVEVVLPGDTENGGSSNVLTAARIDLSTGANVQNTPEIDNGVTVAGPAIVKIKPIVGAKIFITYKKDRNEGSGGDGGGSSPTAIPITPLPIFSPTPTAIPITPIPVFSPTPTATATATFTPFPLPTVTPTPTFSPTPTATATATFTPFPLPSITPRTLMNP
jgi:hypothetical protein